MGNLGEGTRKKISEMTPEERSAYFKALGAKGGNATVAKYGTAHMQEIGVQGFNALADRVGSSYTACRMIQGNKAWPVLEGKKIGGHSYSEYFANKERKAGK
jgi:hypothetical protein